MKKRLLGLILALGMVVAVAPMALAEDGAGTPTATSGTYKTDAAAVEAGMRARIGAEGSGAYYSTLREAVNKVHEEQNSDNRMKETVITLLADVSNGQGIAIGYTSIDSLTGVTEGENPVNITIDLNGKTYTITRDYVGSSTTNTNGFQLLRGSTVKIRNGSIASQTNKIFVQNYSDLTLKNINLNVPNASYAVSCNFGETEIVGNTNITTNNTAIDVYYWPGNSYGDGVALTVNTTGTIKGKITYGSDDTEDGKQNVAEKAVLSIQSGTFTGNIFPYDLGTEGATGIEIVGGTFENEEAKKDIEKYIPDGMTIDTDTGKVVIADDAVASVNGQGFKTLGEAIDAVKEQGGTITLLNDAELNDASNYTIKGDVTIQGNYTITASPAAGQRTKVFTVEAGGKLTLDGVTLDVTGTHATNGKKEGDGINVKYGAELVLNNATVTFTDMFAPLVFESSSATTLGKVTMNNSAITASGTRGNFSNGGDWTVKNGSSITITDNGNHALSVGSLVVDNSTVRVDGAKYLGLYGSAITLRNNANVSVTNSATDSSYFETNSYGRAYLKKGAIQLKGAGTLNCSPSSRQGNKK